MAAAMVSTLLLACAASPETNQPRLEPSAKKLYRAVIANESRYALPGSDHRFAVRVPKSGLLEIGIGVAQRIRVPPEIEARVAFESDGESLVLLRQAIGGPNNLQALGWHDFSLSLAGLRSREGTLSLTIRTAPGEELPDGVVVWGNPTWVPIERRGPPNFVLISIDTLRADRLGCYDHGRDTSPNIDRMAREGILFKNAVASSSWTLPSHASMLTGLDPRHHGAVRFGKEGTPLPKELDTLAEQLWRAGLETAAFVGGGFVDPAFGFDQGFDKFRVRAQLSKDAFADNMGRAVRWMRNRLQRPFFVFLHTYQVHAPYAPPPPYDRMFDPEYSGPLRGSITPFHRPALREDRRLLEHAIALYDGSIRYTDSILGDLLDFLTASGLEKNTCVVLTSDHGEEFLEHGDLMHARAKLYTELVHVPLIFWCPSRFRGGHEVKGVVSLVDVTPTLLAIAGVPMPQQIQGRSLLATLQGGPAPAGRMVVSDTDGSVEYAKGSVLAITGDRYKLIDSSLQGDQRTLFDLVEDPEERVNLYDSRPELAASLRPALERALANRNDTAAQLPSPRAEIDSALRERLRALGYDP